jgi:hypothetical protein
LIEGAVFGTLFTPLGLKPTVLFPGTNGGANSSFTLDLSSLSTWPSSETGVAHHSIRKLRRYM